MYIHCLNLFLVLVFIYQHTTLNIVIALLYEYQPIHRSIDLIEEPLIEFLVKVIFQNSQHYQYDNTVFFMCLLL